MFYTWHLLFTRLEIVVVNSLGEEIDLNREQIAAELEELNREIEELERRISVLTNELRYKRVHRYDLEYRLKEMCDE